MTARSQALVAIVAASIAVAFFQLAVPLRATYGARISGDEPFYLMTAESMLVDRDLDLRNQYATESYRAYYDHVDPLWYQSVAQAGGELLSPHNLGLSILLMPGFAVGGLDGAKRELTLVAAAGVGLLYLLVHRITGRMRWSLLIAVGLATTAPWLIYSAQVYPEAPAATALLAGLLAVSASDRLGVGRALAVAAAVAALAWLGSKYLVLAGILTLAGFVLANRRGRIALVGVLAINAVAYASFHLSTYGGFTPYSANAMFAGRDDVSILGAHLDGVDRLYRLLGLWVDREFGLLHYAPVLFLAWVGLWHGPPLPARLWRTALALVIAEVLIAAFVSITMRGWWFPGRMLMVVYPLLGLAIARGVLGLSTTGRIAAVALALASWAISGALARSVAVGELALAVDPFALHFPLFGFADRLFPDYQEYSPVTIGLTAVWIAVLGLTAMPSPWWAAPAVQVARSGLATSLTSLTSPRG